MSIQLPGLNSSLEQLEKFANVEFIITDLDGTLVQKGTDVFGQLLGLQKKLGNLNITITIATGRTLAGAEAIARKMQIKKGTPIALYNGAVVLSYQKNNILYRKTIPNSVLQELCSLINLERQYFLAYYLMPGEENKIIETVQGFGNISMDKDVNGMHIVWRNGNSLQEAFMPPAEYTQNMSDILLFQYKFEPCSIMIDKKIIGNQAKQLTHYLKNCPLISCTSSGGNFWEIRAKGVNKGIIFPFIKKYNGDRTEEIDSDGNIKKKYIAIGDNDNDVELLQRADIGIVVANGSPAAVNAAEFRCQHEGVQGVLDLIRTIKEAKRYCKDV